MTAGKLGSNAFYETTLTMKLGGRWREWTQFRLHLTLLTLSIFVLLLNRLQEEINLLRRIYEQSMRANKVEMEALYMKKVKHVILSFLASKRAQKMIMFICLFVC